MNTKNIPAIIEVRELKGKQKVISHLTVEEFVNAYADINYTWRIFKNEAFFNDPEGLPERCILKPYKDNKIPLQSLVGLVNERQEEIRETLGVMQEMND